MKCITAQGNHFCIDGQPVMLRGIGVGSWLNLEHYELGIPGWDGQIRQALSERCPGFMDRFTRGFFTEADASYLVSLGLTFIRVPVNHHLFWDEETNTWLEYGFSLIRHLGEICEHAGLYFLLDMHTAPGGQNPDWHSECRTGFPEFWHYQVFRDISAEMLRRIAAELKDCPALLGYDILNEPVIPDGSWDTINRYFRQAVKAVRQEDPHHLIFLEGDFFAMNFSRVEIPDADGLALSLHFYPGVWQSGFQHLPRMKRKLELSSFLESILKTIQDKNLPILCGETGFDHLGEDVSFWRGVVEDIVDCFEERSISWCLWNYKDIGLIGLASPDPEGRWMKMCGKIALQWNHHRAEKIGYETADAAESILGHVLTREEKYALQFSVRAHLAASDVRHILVPCLKEYSEEDLLRMADEFRFENCTFYHPLEEVLRQYCQDQR